MPDSVVPMIGLYMGVLGPLVVLRFGLLVFRRAAA